MIDSAPVKEIRPFPPLPEEVPECLSKKPSCFVSTSMFDNIPHLREETRKLQGRMGGEKAEYHILENTIHWSFVDLVFWLGRVSGRVYGKMGEGVGVEEMKVEESYVELFDVTTAFLLKVKEGKEKEE